LFSTVPSRDADGSKKVTDDDALSDGEIEANNNNNTNNNNNDDELMASLDDNGQPKKICKYGATCYRKNPQHLSKFSHPKNPSDSSSSSTTTTTTTATPATVPDNEATMALDIQAIAKQAADSNSDKDDADDDEKEEEEKKKKGEEEDEEDDVMDDGDEQALITKQEWKQVVKRVVKLEATIFSMQVSAKDKDKTKNNNTVNNTSNTSTTSTASTASTTSKKRPAEQQGSSQPAKKFKGTK